MEENTINFKVDESKAAEAAKLIHELYNGKTENINVIRVEDILSYINRADNKVNSLMENMIVLKNNVAMHIDELKRNPRKGAEYHDEVLRSVNELRTITDVIESISDLNKILLELTQKAVGDV